MWEQAVGGRKCVAKSVEVASAGSPPQYGHASHGSARTSAPPQRSGWGHGSQGTPSSPDGASSAVDALTDSMHSVSFSSPDPKRGRGTHTSRRKSKKPGPDDLEEARTRTIYVSDLNKGITETELVRWFGVAGHVLECRICSDMNTSKRFAFVEFADKEGFEQGALCSPSTACVC
jgi:RNA recognition motif. (a.k.a. RRM, RBD, or RNP domain)